MLSDLSSPVLSLAADVVKDLEGEVAVCSLWCGERVPPMPPVLPRFPHQHPWRLVFTKCKSSIQDGRRLENLSWRLWHREMSMSTFAASQNNPPLLNPTETTPSFETDLPVLVSPIASPVLGAILGPLPKGTNPNNRTIAFLALSTDVSQQASLLLSSTRLLLCHLLILSHPLGLDRCLQLAESSATSCRRKSPYLQENFRHLRF